MELVIGHRVLLLHCILSIGHIVQSIKSKSHVNISKHENITVSLSRMHWSWNMYPGLVDMHIYDVTWLKLRHGWNVNS